MQLDLEFVRQQFSQLDDNPEIVFASNAGGSLVCNQVNDLMDHYNRHTRVQPYSRFTPSQEAGQAMDRAKQAWADALNISLSELTMGPSTSMNTYVMAQAIGATWNEGDEIIVTNQDHEANSGSWRRKALEKGVTIKQWAVDKETGLLDPDQLFALLSSKTRWVFFTHCSNIVGTENPVADITKQIKAQSTAKVFIDAVAHAPHHIADLKQLGVDAYTFSLYKVFGPHQSILYVSQTVHAELKSQAHYFNSGHPEYDFNPAGPQHAQVAASAGVIDYFDALHQHHFGETSVSQSQKMADIHPLIQAHENSITQPILTYLDGHAKVQLIGKTHVNDNDRAPTIAFKPLKQSSAALASSLQKAGIGTENGNFYAHRLISDLGFDADDGVVRVSLLHYDRSQEVERILLELDRALG